MKSNLLLIFLIFFSFASFAQDFTNGEYLDGIAPGTVLSSPDYITQRQVASSSFSNYSVVFDSTFFEYAKADDAGYAVKSNYRLNDGQWEKRQIDSLFYDSQDREIASNIYVLFGTISSPVKRTNTTYDGVVSTKIEEKYSDDEQWTFDIKTVTDFYGNGNVKEIRRTEWDAESSSWKPNRYFSFTSSGYFLVYETFFTKYTYERDEEDRVLIYTAQDYDSGAEALVNTDKEVYNWTGDTLQIGYHYGWENDAWLFDSKIISHFENKRIVLKLELDSVGINQYENNSLREYTRNDDGVNTIYKYNKWILGQWETLQVNELTLDVNGFDKKRTIHSWVQDSMKLLVTREYNTIYDGNGNRLYSDSQKWDFTTSSWLMNSWNKNYFEDYENGLVSLQDLQEVKVNVFPNPTTDNISFTIDETKEVYQASFYSTSGKLLFSTQVMNNQSIDVAHFPKGLYYFVIKGQDFGATGKINKL